MSETANIETTKPYTLRNLSSKDIFAFSTILKQIGYAELKECFRSSEIKSMIAGMQSKNISIDEIGISIMMDISTVVISNLASAEESIYKLLSNLSGMPKAELEKLDADVFAEMVIDVFQQEGFRNFLRVVSRLFK